MALISLEHVSKVYPKGSRPALDDVSLDIDRGNFVFLVGASGSGKTTLLSLLLHEEEATEGEIRVAGNDLRRLSNRQVPMYRRSIGFVFQDYKLLTNKTVWQNVAFALEVIGTRRSTIKSLVPQVLKTVGLTGKENNFPHELSGGEAQRVAIARAYVNHPQILLADEPTGNLDPTTSLGIMEVLEAINRTGTTIVMATHNEEIVNSMRKRVVELHTGKIVRDEATGSYDSAKFFPDAEVEAQAHHAIKGGAIETHADIASEIAPTPEIAGGLAESKNTEERSADTQQAISDAEQGAQGIARLANSVHSGRKGRYGEAFAPVETTLTWGKGIVLDPEHAGNAHADQTDDEQSSAKQTSGKQPSEGQSRAEQSGDERSDIERSRSAQSAEGTQDGSQRQESAQDDEAAKGDKTAIPAPPTPPGGAKGTAGHDATGKQTGHKQDSSRPEAAAEEQGDKK
ncbi:cell division ATP-binding protein FtsE [Bifidobacterium psychraerophilum]|uniref:Cell division ATP-binding protein FtsE n=1 Tax=Bifidobacterium psychraerophilum TaxID=218140 RepID=A0A087CGD4_9BIFI|nr:cell division ATP-binding protein FtsE [Bifidobacterium psychraerophilum]KFI82334.1 cell division ATP-binding protein FtsE [Bifidobacterium psychraerophilum]PKA95136.1 cell division transport system ATP-binding protein [Bifidobacterium psychraerophilum DSM 22366]